MSAGVPPVGPGDVYQYQGELYNGDPRIAPGLARPIGWRTRVPDGTAAYDKFGPLDTNWVPVGTSSSGVATIAAAYAAGAANRPVNDLMAMVNGTTARFQANSDANTLPLIGLYETGASKPLTTSGYPAIGLSLATDLSILIGGRIFNWFEMFDPLWNGTFAQLAGYAWQAETCSFQQTAGTAWRRNHAFADRSYTATKNWQPQATPAGPLGSGPGTMLHRVDLYNTLDDALLPIDQLDGFGQNIRQVSPIQNGVIYETAAHFSHRLVLTPAADDGVGWGIWDGDFNHGGDVPRAAWSARTVGASAAGDWYLAFSLQDTAGDGQLHDVATFARTGITFNAPVTFTANAAASIYCDGIATGAIQLSTLASGSFNKGALAWVQSVRALFVLTLASLTTDAITVVNATGKAGYQWIRRVLPERYWWSAATFPTQVDPANSTGVASDENTGLAGAPLRTWAEWYRRTQRAQVNFNIVVAALSDATDNDDIVWDLDPYGAAVTMAIQGVTSVVSTQTVASAQARTPASNLANQITVIAFDFSPYLGSLVRVQGTTNYAVITKVLTTTTANDTARLGELWNTATLSQASATGIAAPAVIEITSQTKGPLRYTVLGAQAPTFQDLRLDGTGAVRFVTTRSQSTFIVRRCVFAGTTSGVFRGFDFSGGLMSCSFRTNTAFAAAQGINLLGSAYLMTGNPTIAHNAQKVIFTGHVCQAVTVQVATGSVRVTGDFGTFDLAAGKTGLDIPFDSIGGNVKFTTGRHYGSGNNATALVWAINSPGVIAYQNAQPPTCDAGNGVSIQGTNVAIGALPSPINANNGCGVLAL
jgi:hypothetical protein